MNEPTITDLWQVEDQVWEIEDRQVAIEAAFNALVLALHEAGAFRPGRLQLHLQAAARQVEIRGGEEFRGAAAALDALARNVGALPPRSSGTPAGN